MAQRPGFPVKLDQKTTAKPAKVAAAHSPSVNPQGLGLDSSAVRRRMVEKLAAQGLKDPVVLEAMGASTKPTKTPACPSDWDKPFPSPMWWRA